LFCHNNQTSQHECKKNHEGISGGMGGAGVLHIFDRSLHTQGICYTEYLGNGDSIAYQRVVAGKPYDPNIAVTKLECVSRVQERMRAALRILMKEKTRRKLHDSKPLGGKGRPTHSEIDKLQNYYGLAIRRNVNNLEVMKRALWAVFFHKLLTNENPSMMFAQVVVTVGLNSRTVPVQWLHMSINILYRLLLWMQLNQCSGTLLVQIF
jgi:hypothetical protein